MNFRQTANDITAEHSCIMICKIAADEEKDFEWLDAYWRDFRRRFITLLSYSFNGYSPSLALGVLTNKNVKSSNSGIYYIWVTNCSPQFNKIKNHNLSLNYSQLSRRILWMHTSHLTTWSAWKCTAVTWLIIIWLWIYYRHSRDSISSILWGTRTFLPYKLLVNRTEYNWNFYNC